MFVLIFFRHCRTFFFSSVIPVLDTGICKEDPRVKPEGDCSKKEPEHDYKEKEAQI